MNTLQSEKSCVLVVDIQTGLLPAINDNSVLLETTTNFIQAAKLLDVPVLATEHWADKIGNTHADLLPYIQNVFHKTHFDAALEDNFSSFIPAGRHDVLVLGTEAHVCVLQTGLGLKRLGFNPILVTDCIGSRHINNKNAAIARWRHNQLLAVTSEMAMFEWVKHPSHPKFKQVLGLIK